MKLPPDHAIVCRVRPLADGEMLIELLVPRDTGLDLCTKHPRPVYFDGGECPCCELMREHAQWKVSRVNKEQAQKEFLLLTDEVEG